MSQTGTETGRKRAPAMNAEDRREAVVAAALPLLVEHGGSVTTSQIAAAAGIAEGTVFRVFKDKRELYLACLRTALRSERQIAEIEAIDANLPLAGRLVAGIGIVAGYQRRMWSILEAFRAAGIEVERKDFTEAAKKAGADEGREQQEGSPEHGFHLISQTIAGLFGADQGALRVDPDLAARLLLGLMFTNHMQNERLGGGMAEPAELVDLFLHGTMRTDDEGDEEE